MTSITISTSTQSTLFPKPTSTIPCKTHPSLPLTFSKPQNPFSFQLCCSPHTPPPPHSITKTIPTLITKTLILLTFSLTLLSLRLTSNLLLPDFPKRWNHLISFSSEAEAKLINHHYPHHLLQAIVAYEDRRFFRHFGVDPVGVARAVLSFSKRGGGSTITQQIYWGHGIYGVESASSFYFGKHPSLLSLGECAMLAGIIPAPELRSPFRDSGRGKIFQARVLRRMVEVGFIDLKTALHVVKQPLHFDPHGPHYADGFPLTLSREVPGLFTTLKGGAYSDVKNIWDWEGESKIWEVKEDMERWLISLSGRNKEVEKLPHCDHGC